MVTDILREIFRKMKEVDPNEESKTLYLDGMKKNARWSRSVTEKEKRSIVDAILDRMETMRQNAMANTRK